MSDSIDPEKAMSAAAGLAKALPVYEDAIQPVAEQVGKALATVGAAVNAALLPLKGLVWGAEKFEEFLQTNVSRKLENVPPERIVTPPLHVAGPVLESLRYTGNEPALREMYANLLAASMDSQT